MSDTFYNKQKIYTLALNKLGITEPVELDSNNVNAVVLDNEYKTTLEILLSEVDWNFARKSRILTMAKEDNGKFYFDIPNDCINTREVISAQTGEKLKYDTCGGEIITSEDAVSLFYTTRDVNENKFPAEFVRTLCYALAASVALALTESEKKLQMMNALYIESLSKAAVINANQGNETVRELEYYEVR